MDANERQPPDTGNNFKCSDVEVQYLNPHEIPMTNEELSIYTKPTYTLGQRNEVDLSSSSKTGTTELVLSVDLPRITSASAVELDIFEARIELKSENPAKYLLKIDLPYKVDEKHGSAKFDKCKHSLIIALSVVSGKSTGISQGAPGTNNTANGTMDELAQQTGKDEFGCNSEKSITSYVVPEYDFFQDNRTVTFILLCKKVVKASVTKSFPLEGRNGCHVKFTAIGTDGVPIYFSFVVRFPDDKRIDVDKTDVDVSRDNAVLVFTKAKDSRGSWVQFEAGCDTRYMEKNIFVCEDSVGCEVNEFGNGGMPGSPPDLHVTDLNDNNTTIQFKARSSRVSKFSESSDDIEVIFTKERPRIHGILKRTMSESSEDPLSCSYGSMSHISFSRENSVNANGSESVISEEEEGRRPRSVSFSEYVDRTSFKQGTSVSTLHATLKSKRKRQRKHDESVKNKGERRRTTSSGSCSDSHSDAETHSDHEETTGSSASDLSPQFNQVVKFPLPGNDGEAAHADNQQKKKRRNKKRKNKNKENIESNDGNQSSEINTDVDTKPVSDSIGIEGTNGHQPPETINSADTKLNQNYSGLIPIAGTDGHQPPETSVCVDAKPVSKRNRDKSIEGLDGHQPPETSVCDDIANLSISETSHVGKSVVTPVVDQIGGQIPGEVFSDTKNNLDERTNTQDCHSNPPGNRPFNEHKAQCAFEFKNKLMFEMDDD